MASSASNGLSHIVLQETDPFSGTDQNAQGTKMVKNNGVSPHGCGIENREMLCVALFFKYTGVLASNSKSVCLCACVCVLFCSPLLSPSELPLITETYHVIKKETHQNRVCLQSFEKRSLGTWWLLSCSGSCGKKKNRQKDGRSASLTVSRR